MKTWSGRLGWAGLIALGLCAPAGSQVVVEGSASPREGGGNRALELLIEHRPPDLPATVASAASGAQVGALPASQVPRESMREALLREAAMKIKSLAPPEDPSKIPRPDRAEGDSGAGGGKIFARVKEGQEEDLERSLFHRAMRFVRDNRFLLLGAGLLLLGAAWVVSAKLGARRAQYALNVPPPEPMRRRTEPSRHRTRRRRL